MSVAFSKNYENKQRHEIQKAYFGHENFTIFITACYFHETMMIPNSKLDVQFRLLLLPLAIVSNETSHNCNVAFSNNNTIIKWIQQLLPSVKKFHFWSDGCAGQFRSKFVSHSFSYYPRNINLIWNYGEAHHFKGLLISKLMAL